jgi:hypothetical protein
MATGSVHDEATNKALNLLKDLTANSDGWEFSSEVENVKLYNRQIEGEPLPIMRGDTLLPGHEFTPQQVASVATLPGCRVIWDDKYGTSEIKTMYSRWSALFWASIKSPYPI